MKVLLEGTLLRTECTGFCQEGCVTDRGLVPQLPSATKKWVQLLVSFPF